MPNYEGPIMNHTQSNHTQSNSLVRFYRSIFP